MRNQKGFTLIELIIVIVVLGILAVTAAPQFIDFSTDARTSTVNGLKGSAKAASQLVHARALADSAASTADTATTPEEVTVGGSTVVLNYRYAAAHSFIGALDISDEWSEELADGADVNTIGSTASAAAATQAIYYPEGVNSPTAATDAGTCYVIYQEAGSDGDQPEVEAVTDGC